MTDYGVGYAVGVIFGFVMGWMYNHKPGVCTYIPATYRYARVKPTCEQNDCEMTFTKDEAMDFNLCPYCGKKIQVKADEPL